MRVYYYTFFIYIWAMMAGSGATDLVLAIQEEVRICLQGLTTELPVLDNIITRIESCISALGLVQEHMSTVPDWIIQVIHQLEEADNAIIDISESGQEHGGATRGRPPFVISRGKLEYMLSLSFKVPDKAKMMGVSRETIFRRFREYGLSVKQTYTQISDEELQDAVTSQLLTHPNTGYKRMRGFLSSKNIRVTDQRVREVMRIVDPMGVYQRTKQNRAIVRREYFVPYFNSMWHIDGNHKLNRWGIVVRCGIDGKTRMVTYIAAIGDNRANAHLESFLTGVQKYGVPFRTRSDKGGENTLIARYVIEQRGCNRASHICGRSVHNQRIERFWKDVFYGSLSFFYNVFRTMEQDGFLNIDDPRHICILHKVFLPRLNDNLRSFSEGWNLHPLSSEHNYTPRQLMLMHLPPPDCDMIPDMVSDDIIMGNHADIANFMEAAEESIVNPIHDYSCLNEAQEFYLDQINYLRQSNNFGPTNTETPCFYFVKWHNEKLKISMDQIGKEDLCIFNGSKTK